MRKKYILPILLMGLLTAATPTTAAWLFWCCGTTPRIAEDTAHRQFSPGSITRRGSVPCLTAINNFELTRTYGGRLPTKQLPLQGAEKPSIPPAELSPELSAQKTNIIYHPASVDLKKQPVFLFNHPIVKKELPA